MRGTIFGLAGESTSDVGHVGHRQPHREWVLSRRGRRAVSHRRCRARSGPERSNLDTHDEQDINHYSAAERGPLERNLESRYPPCRVKQFADYVIHPTPSPEIKVR
jgi:hypothetical protein